MILLDRCSSSALQLPSQDVRCIRYKRFSGASVEGGKWWQVEPFSDTEGGGATDGIALVFGGEGQVVRHVKPQELDTVGLFLSSVSGIWWSLPALLKATINCFV